MVNYNKQFPYYVEDWMLWLSCRVDRFGNIIDFPFYATPPVKVANYDVKFIENTGYTLSQGIGFTNAQAQLAVRIITKHRKQIKKQLNIDVGYLQINAEFKLPIRKVQNNFELILGSNNHYLIRFPYQPQMVDRMHHLSAYSSGDFSWNNSERLWYIARTEKNLRLLYSFLDEFKRHPWKVDDRIQKDLDVAHQVLNNRYEYIPNVDLVDGNYTVNNSNEHIDSALKDFNFNQTAPNICLRLEKHGLVPGKNLTNHIQDKYSSIANALLISQADVLKQGKKLESVINHENLEDFMLEVDARFWVFATFDLESHSVGKAKEIAFGTPTTGEKIFLSHGRSLRDESPTNMLSDLDLKDSIIITDNAMMLGKYYTKKIIKTPVMKMFYLFGE